MRTLRFLTYLAPSIPQTFFDLVTREVGARIGLPTALDLETSVSGPSPSSDPFRSGRADFAFVCSPSYPQLRRAGTARLVAAAPVFDDPRGAGRPVYFVDVVVATAHRASSLCDLAGGTWAYNDPASLSGWHSLRARLAELGHGRPENFFRRVLLSGSHLRSLELVASGRADASAIDSNALAVKLERDPALAARLRVLESWGPLPIQPLLASELHRDARVRRGLGEARVARFAEVDSAFYDSFPVLAAAAGEEGSPAGATKGRA